MTIFRKSIRSKDFSEEKGAKKLKASYSLIG